MFNRNKRFTFFVLSNDLYPNVILTLTNSKAQCLEFYNKYLCKKHFHMFKPWCENNDLDPTNPSSWTRYTREKISSAESSQYKISKITFSKDELAALMRTFSQTPMIGCSFESTFEKSIRDMQGLISDG